MTGPWNWPPLSRVCSRPGCSLRPLLRGDRGSWPAPPSRSGRVARDSVAVLCLPSATEWRATLKNPPHSGGPPYPPASAYPGYRPAAQVRMSRKARQAVNFARAGKSGESGKVSTGPEDVARSEEHTSELQSRVDLVCRLLLEKKKRGIRDKMSI